MFSASIGLTPKETAEALGYSYAAIRAQRASAVIKMDAKNFTHAVAKALRQGVIE